MFLAVRELRRARSRFALLVGAVALLAFLILFQQAIRDSLLTSFVGGIRNATSDVVVFDVDGRRFLQASTVGEDLERVVRDVDGVDAVGRIGQGTFPVRAGGAVEPVAVVGADRPGIGVPASLVEGRTPSAPGEVIANAADGDRGFGVGERLTVEPTGLVLTVVGRAADVGLNVTPTVYGGWDTYLAVAQTRNPGLRDLVPNALGVRPAPGVDARELAQRINAASG
jgi:putative ABC transport system permease protein